mmetsp:Transcript_63255/g.105260  ORF Transcript_63255/g.105260 Transcript_63255/m.105260 type:complete len:255 (+) Transcript_63255:95-859(+)|eukprot:CAMPEP_0119306980 /NCGR_PEP_ID=MMETSP1333-20130426/7601_1 /TAXON_ID=418940 /ORGANISM="Scyphosphaera apsteinii, Strain RCC1455" /LENGTH=254 /DNA_ID=CAMNT_0007310423 /DNA_START=105 /DNA_END=869 /DNA_ORIENTATION=+
MDLSSVPAGRTAEWLAALVQRDGTDSVADALFDACNTDQMLFIIEKLQKRLASLNSVGRMSCSGEDPQVIEAVAYRSKEGQIGLEIRDEPSLNVFNVIVGIAPGSTAERDANFKLGDVIIEVDGLRLFNDGSTLEVRDAMKTGQPKYSFKLLRQPPRDVTSASASTNLPLSSPAWANAPSSMLAARFDANTPRSTIFAHAAALTNKHNKLARARGSFVQVVTPRTAQASCTVSSSDGDEMLQLSRTTSDFGLLV